jgi:spoIIIJ-associated protein
VTSWIEAAGNTVEDAIKEALKEMGVDRRQVELEVIDSGSKGWLGIIGGKQARVRVRMKRTPDQAISEFLEQVFVAMGLNVEFRVTEEEGYWRVNCSGTDVRLLIGRRGETLNALQLLTSLAINKRLEEKVRLIMDAEGYRERREETLCRLARRLAERVRRLRREVTLEPMAPSERRIIHIALQDNPWVETESAGEEPFRRVVISPRRRGGKARPEAASSGRKAETGGMRNERSRAYRGERHYEE